MEKAKKAKKPTCGCFSFLKKKGKKQIDRSLIIEQREAESIPDNKKDLNASMDHTLITTQKFFSPGNFYKSTIMAPSCRTPQMHNIPGPVFSLSDHFKIPTARIVKKIQSSAELNKNETEKSKSLEDQAKKKEDFNENFRDLNSQKNKLVFKGFEPVISPNMDVLEKSNLAKVLPALEISPVKSIISVDDYSDIVQALSFPSNRPVPDLFIRNKIKAKPLPLLKSFTPRYLGRQIVLPKMRKDNQVLLETLVYK